MKKAVFESWTNDVGEEIFNFAVVDVHPIGWMYPFLNKTLQQEVWKKGDLEKEVGE